MAIHTHDYGHLGNAASLIALTMSFLPDRPHREGCLADQGDLQHSLGDNNPIVTETAATHQGRL